MGLLDILKGTRRLSPQEQAFVNKQAKQLAKYIGARRQTDDIQKFFTNYRNAKSTVKDIASIAGWDTKCIAGETPHDCMESLYRDAVEPTKDCIDRYVRKETVRIMGLTRGRMKAARGVASILEEFEPDMPPGCSEFAKGQVERMMKKIERLEAE